MERILSKKAGASYLEILIMIISIFSFSFLISLPEIKAQDMGPSLRCCPEDEEGSICQDFPIENCGDSCAVNCLPTSCEKTSICKPGCCIDPEEGLCTPNSPQRGCGIENWKDDPDCNILECRKGCCLLGNEVQFTTEKHCEVLSSFYDLAFDFRPDINNELKCLLQAGIQAIGACIIEAGDKKTCKFIGQAECLQLTGSLLNFHEDILCTKPELETNCEPTEETSCIEGKDEVYFLDSCGNRANIYDALKVNSGDYWSEVKIKEDSCGFGDSNSDSKTCGNCDRFLGSRCGKGQASYGDNICKGLNCKDAPYIVDAEGKVLKTKDRKNGESWCVYDGYTSGGRDVVGSRHFKYYCYEGGVKVEPCADFRQEICVEDVANGISSATCRINRWRKCLDYNDMIEKVGDNMNYEKMIEECEKNVDCYAREVNVDSGFHFWMCMPNYPSGFDLNDEVRSDLTKETCGAGDNKCIVVYVKTISGWECELNCDCEGKKFTHQMNDLCIGLGDCGGYVNILGKEDEAYSVSGAPKISLEQYQQYTQPVEGQIAGMGNLTGFDNEWLAREGFSAVVSGADEDDVEYNAFDELRWLAMGVCLIPGVGWLACAIIGLGNLLWDLLKKIPIIGDILGFAEDIINGILEMIFGWGDTKEKIITFKCYPWQAPSGGKDCEKCGSELKICSEYRCSSLGQDCKLINEGTGQEKCMWNNPNDASAPKISPWYGIIREGYKYDEVNEQGFKIKQEDGQCAQVFATFTFGIEISENAQCKMDEENVNFEEMEDYFGQDNLYKKEHKMLFTVQMPKEMNETGEYAYTLDEIGKNRFYVRCQDANGNVNIKPYLIDICVRPGPDLTAPMILKTNPVSGSHVRYGEIEQEVFLYVNEPADCKWSFEDKKYDLMENEMSCETGFEHIGLYGWICFDTLPLEQETFYVRCKDQPWLDGTVNETERNANSESYVYKLKKSEAELEITKTEPEGTITSGNEPMSVTLKLETSGGAQDGIAGCYFEWSGDWILFYDTFSSIHIQEDWNLLRGTHVIPIKCEDIAGNIAEGKIEFKLKIDSSPPKVIRVYNDGTLKLITNEDAECVYSSDTCNFIWNNATKISGFGKEHTTGWEQGLTYHVKCKDLWENKPGGCSIIVKAV